MNLRKALITGITGQDGAYLSKLLLEKGYKVYGAIRRSSVPNLNRLEALGIANNIEYCDLDLTEYNNIFDVIRRTRPNEIYNLAAQSFVATSFNQPIYTAEVDALGVTRILEALRALQPEARFYQASTSEMFGRVQTVPQNEMTPLYPRSPYGVAKLYAHWITVNYREAYNMFATSGILFNHESPLRGRQFVTRKITLSLAEIKQGHAETLELGNMDAQRDWGFAGDYVVGMWKMLQHDTPDTYVLASGEMHTVREFVEKAAMHLGFQIEWQGSGVDEVGIDKKTGKQIVRINPQFYRPAEVEQLLGDATKAKEELKWESETQFGKLVEMMVETDYDRVKNGRVLV
jgi:GDPmannose 4,6-dehydratase